MIIKQVIRAWMVVAAILIFSPKAFFQAGEERLARIDALIAAEEYQKAVIAIDEMNENQVLINKNTDYYYSVCYNRMGLYDIALQYCEAYDTYKTDARGQYEYAIANYGTGNYEQALAGFEWVEPQYESNQEFFYYYGSALYYTEDYQGAMERLEKLVPGDSKNEYMNYNLYRCYYETEEYARGIRQVEKDLKALDKEDEYYEYDRDDLLYYRSDFYYLSENYQRAIADYETLIAENSYYLDEVYYLLAKCYVKLDEFDLAYDNMELGLEYDSYYYYEVYKYDEDLQVLFEDERYADKIAELEQLYGDDDSYYEEDDKFF